MKRVRVYGFKVWDQTRGDYVESNRLATRQAIKANPQLVLIDEGSMEIDAGLLDGNGMTRRAQDSD